jgi:uncharacterized protein (TIGR00255 family)
VRSLNSKGLDLSVRVPSVYRDKELELRSTYGELVVRGKSEVSIYIENNSGEKRMHLDTDLMNQYYNELTSWKEGKDLGSADILSTLMRMPEVMKFDQAEPTEDEWNSIAELVKQAFDQFENYRKTEGAKLQKEFEMRIENILRLRADLIAPIEERKEKTRERIKAQLDELVGKERIDENRFEQELIYYLEKLDVSEELQRLLSNCEMFNEELNGGAQGRKLGFISQEIGREVNTIGSKANDAMMQRMVVEMKDELEKIKEQINNVL